MANVSPFNQILGKWVQQFCVIVLTNELTNADEIINSLPVVGGSNINNNYVWYGIVEFNVPLDTVWVISEMGGPEQWCAHPIQ